MNTQTTLPDDQKDNDLDNSIAGGVTTNHIVKWKGSAWSALGLCMDDIVEDLGQEKLDI